MSLIKNTVILAFTLCSAYASKMMTEVDQSLADTSFLNSTSRQLESSQRDRFNIVQQAYADINELRLQYYGQKVKIDLRIESILRRTVGCEIKHHNDVVTRAYGRATETGQNIASFTYCNNDKNKASCRPVRLWYGEYKYFDFDKQQCILATPKCQHFTIMMAPKITAMGCAVSPSHCSKRIIWCNFVGQVATAQVRRHPSQKALLDKLGS